MEYHKHIFRAFISPGLKDILNNDEDNFDCFIFQAINNYHNDVTIHTLFYFSKRKEIVLNLILEFKFNVK